jgi:hypothetical protein
MTHKIEIIDWSHTCGDGCCHTYGTELKINGERINLYFDINNQEDWEAMFKALNVEAEIIYKSDYND